MKRRFNITGSCNPQWHYMVSLDDRLKKIKEDYVDYGSYFVINRGRQYGKTMTLEALKRQCLTCMKAIIIQGWMYRQYPKKYTSTRQDTRFSFHQSVSVLTRNLRMKKNLRI